MSNYTFSLTKTQIEQMLCGSLDAGTKVLGKLRQQGVPVLGKTWPVAVTRGVLKLEYDDVFETFSWTWLEDGAPLDRETCQHWFSLTHNPGLNPVHLATVVRRNLERTGAVVIGASWAMAIENGALFAAYDDTFEELLFWWEAA